MKIPIALVLAIMMISLASSYATIMNPFTGKLDYVNYIGNSTPVQGTGVAGQVGIWSNNNTLGGLPGSLWDGYSLVFNNANNIKIAPTNGISPMIVSGNVGDEIGLEGTTGQEIAVYSTPDDQYIYGLITADAEQILQLDGTSGNGKFARNVSMNTLKVYPSVDSDLHDIPILEFGNSSGSFGTGCQYGIYWSNYDTGNADLEFRDQCGNLYGIKVDSLSSRFASIDTIYSIDVHSNNLYGDGTYITGIPKQGNCSAGKVVQNVTSGGVQCVSASSSSGTLNWTNITNFPVACPAGTYVTNVSNTITCTAVSGLMDYTNLAMQNQSNNFTGKGIQIISGINNGGVGGIEFSNGTAETSGIRNFLIYAATDTSNTAGTAFYIVPKQQQSGNYRLFIGNSSNKWYSMDFTGVSSFVSLPTGMKQQTGANAGNTCAGYTCSVIGNEGGSLVLDFAGGAQIMPPSSAGVGFSPFNFRTNNNNTNSAYTYMYSFDTNATQSNGANMNHTLWQMNSRTVTLASLDTSGNFLVSKTLGSINASAYSGYTVCYATGGVLGHCTSVVGVGGTCTCVLN